MGIKISVYKGDKMTELLIWEINFIEVDRGILVKLASKLDILIFINTNIIH